MWNNVEHGGTGISLGLIITFRNLWAAWARAIPVVSRSGGACSNLRRWIFSMEPLAKSIKSLVGCNMLQWFSEFRGFEMCFILSCCFRCSKSTVPGTAWLLPLHPSEHMVLCLAEMVSSHSLFSAKLSGEHVGNMLGTWTSMKHSYPPILNHWSLFGYLGEWVIHPAWLTCIGSQVSQWFTQWPSDWTGNQSTEAAFAPSPSWRALDEREIIEIIP